MPVKEKGKTNKIVTRSICGHIGKEQKHTETYHISFGYMQTRDIIFAKEKVNARFLQTQARFREKMKEFMKDKPSNMIFTDDLKNMVHLAEESDLDLVLQVIKKFNSQNKELRCGDFIFGLVVMRMFYHLKATDALEVK